MAPVSDLTSTGMYDLRILVGRIRWRPSILGTTCSTLKFGDSSPHNEITLVRHHILHDISLAPNLSITQSFDDDALIFIQDNMPFL
jgi:hypothetical protein